MADTYNINIDQGSSLSIRATAKDSNGVAINLSGYTASGYVRFRYSDTGILLNLAPVITTPASGIVDISLSGSQTNTLPTTQAVYDVEVYGASGYVLKLLKGYFEIGPQATY